MSQQIASGVTDQFIYFDAPPALSNFVVYGSLDGAPAAIFTTPTVNETDATNMPGVYELLLDEQTTIDAANKTEILKLFIKAGGWAGKSVEIVLFIPESAIAQNVNIAEVNNVTVGGAGTLADPWGPA